MPPPEPSQGVQCGVDTCRGWVWHFGTSALGLGELSLICNPQEETFGILETREVTKEWLGHMGLHVLLYHGLGKCRWAGEAQDET